MKVELPLGDALAYGYQFYAFPLSILATADEPSDWILANFIHVAYDPSEGTPVRFCFYIFDYSQSPWLETVKTDRFWIAASSLDIVKICRTSMEAGYYPYLNLNEFHVPGRGAYGKHDQTHDMLLCGFDDAAETFTVYGYTTNGRLSRVEMARTRFRESYESLERIPNTCHQVFFYRAARDAHFQLDVADVRESIEDYLAGSNASARFAMAKEPMDRIYGMACYEPLQGYLDAYLSGQEPYDARHFHVLWEHKRLMAMRIARLAEITESDRLSKLADESLLVERDAMALRDGMMRHEFARAGKSTYPLTAPKRLAAIRDREREILEEVVVELRSQTAPAATRRPSGIYAA